MTIDPHSSPDAGLKSMGEKNLAQHIQQLASDAFEGRLPGSPGETRTTGYLIKQFKSLGLTPGNPAGSYLQKVPLIGITAASPLHLFLNTGAQELSLCSGQEFVAWSKREVESTSLEDSEVIFVGYGVVAPEYDWDDYKDVDVKDKTLIVLINDPPVPDPDDPSKLDEKTFNGRAMTYYGRWTYKLEQAARKGARACFIIHETGPAGYPWGVVQESFSGEQFDLVTQNGEPSCDLESWLNEESARSLFQLAGHELEALKKAALSREFQPLPLDVKVSLTIKNTFRKVDSHNVVAKVEGSDPHLKEQYVVYLAHWDHLGKKTTSEGEQIYNGAVDNASGTAALLEMARGFAQLETPPRRSLLFLAVTAEEQGLLGSRYYSENPLYPVVHTVAAINMDGMNVLGPTQDVTITGLGNTTLEDLVEAVCKEEGRMVRPDPEPEKGLFYRSDHFSFAKQGVPALSLNPGVDYLGKPEGWGLKIREEYTRKHYHKPSDEYDPDWDLSGLVQDLQLLFQVGYRAANDERYPAWKPGSEFEARRQQMLKQAGLAK
jgi:Zn-dependent M28 family amino/carboxypeptidase